jgi:hypothetical protein
MGNGKFFLRFNLNCYYHKIYWQRQLQIQLSRKSSKFMVGKYFSLKKEKSASMYVKMQTEH